MYYLLPDYYEYFSCSAEKCQDNCCVGWEIQVDDATWEVYRNAPGEWGERFRHCIADEPQNRHFILQKGRCPFLTSSHQCEIILRFGEQALCDVCDEHPRFTFEYGNWMETGLGLCCEEAARLILTPKEPARFLLKQIPEKEPSLPLPECLQRLLVRRTELFSLLQNRQYPLNTRLQALLTAEGAGKLADCTELLKIVSFFMKQESLSPEWPLLLKKTQHFLQSPLPKQQALQARFENRLGDRMIEYEQLAVYFLFRYYLSSIFDHCPKEKIRLTVWFVQIIQALSLAEYDSTANCPNFSDRLRFAQLFSKEVEYNDDALEGLKKLFSRSS